MKYLILITVLFFFLSNQGKSQEYSSGPILMNINVSHASNIQWYKDGLAIANANTETYESNMAGVYWATYDLVSESCNTITSNIFILAIEGGGAITLNGPSEQSNYQWFKDDSVLIDGSYANYNIGADSLNIGRYSLQYNNGSCVVEYGDIIYSVLKGVPDYRVSIVLFNSIVDPIGNNCDFVALFEELNYTDAREDLPVSFTLLKHGRININWNQSFKGPFNGNPFLVVDNTEWEYDDSNPFWHVWRYVGNDSFPAGGYRKLGVNATYNVPLYSVGQSNIILSIPFTGVGGEQNFSNNSDFDVINFDGL